MPSRKAYKTEEDYQRARATVKATTKYKRHLRELDERKTVSDIRVSAWGEVPCDISGLAERTRISDAVSRAADNVAATLRRHLLRRWKATHDVDCIIVINHTYFPKKGKVSYTVELYGYGAKLEHQWLANEIEDYGMEISSYVPQKKYLGNHCQDRQENKTLAQGAGRKLAEKL